MCWCTYPVVTGERGHDTPPGDVVVVATFCVCDKLSSLIDLFYFLVFERLFRVRTRHEMKKSVSQILLDNGCSPSQRGSWCSDVQIPERHVK